MPDLRQDPISGRFVIIAEERAKRPVEFDHQPLRRGESRCPFCEGNEHDTPQAIANYTDSDSEPRSRWQVRVVPNKYPATNGTGQVQSQQPTPSDSIYQSELAAGAHEVIIESPDHLISVTDLTNAQTRLVLRAYRDRLADAADRSELAYGVIFKNSGARAGASLEHLHSQLMALTRVPPEVSHQLENCRQFHRQHDQCAFCRIIEDELARSERVIAESSNFIALCPFASRFDYETWILPRQHQTQFEDASESELTELSQLVRDTVSRFEMALGRPAYNLLVQTGPFDRSAQPHYHWHIQAFPRLTQLAGFELATNCYINCTPPEKAAAVLRRYTTIR